MKPHHYQQWRPCLLVVWAFLFCIPLSLAQSHIEIRNIPYQESFQCSEGNPKFYRLDLSNIPQGLDLIISVLPEEGSTAPKLFVSSSNQFPQKRNDADYSSVSTTRNVIFIDDKDLKEISKSLYLGLVCGEWGSAKILVEWVNEIQVIANEEKIIESSNHDGVSSAVVKLKISKEDDIDRIVIHTDALSSSVDEFLSSLEYYSDSRKRFFFLEVFINEGKSIPDTDEVDNTIRGGSWFEWNTMIIPKNSEIFCTDCVYTLSLKFSENTFVNFKAQTFKKTTKIDGTTTLDGVQKGMLNSYSFAIREAFKEEDFLLSVGIQQGKVKVYVDCDTQPKFSSDYAWSYLVESSREILLTKKDRSKCRTENYFFLVSGEETSIYSLRTMPQKSNQLTLGKDTAVTGQMLSQENITYEIFVPLIAAEEFVLNLRSQQSLDLDVKNCRFSTDCPGQIPPDRQTQKSKYYGFDHQYSDKFTPHSEKVNDELHVKINPQESGCYPLLKKDQTEKKEPFLVCAYLVTLANKQFFPVEYSLAIEYKGLDLLRVGSSEFGSVTKGNGVFYALDLLPYQNIESVQIQFTKFSGDFEVFISKSNKHPNKESHDDVHFSSEGLFILKNLPRLSIPYYIGVYGLETGSFSLSAVIRIKDVDHPWEKKFLMNEDIAWTLTSGKPQKGVLLPKNERPAQFYKLLLAQDNEWEGTLLITVNSPTGRVLLVVDNDGEFPTEEKNMWKTKGQELEISSNDPNFKRQGLYYIGVLVGQNDNKIDDIIYHISYNLLSNQAPTLLSLNKLFNGVIKKDESKEFEFALLDNQFPLTIYKQSKSRNIDLYLSIGSDSKYPSQDLFTYTTKNQEKDYIILTSEDIEKFCKSEICSLYITIIQTGDQEETDYSLLIRSDSSSQPVALHDGHQIQSIAPINNRPAFFYFDAVPSQNSVITVNCSGGDVVVYAKRVKEIRSFEMKSLDAKTAEFTSSDHSGGVTHISIPPVDDSDMTTIALSVDFGDFKTPNEKQLTKFTILASSQILRLSTGTPYLGDVLKDQYLYFVVKVIRPDCALLISLTNIKGDVDLVISYGENTRPTIGDHQFSLITLKKTEVIEIDEYDLSVNSMTGNWVIGIYGRTAASFSLTVVYEEQKMVKLKPGVPVKTSLEESSWTYFTFLQESESNLEIKLTKHSGKVNLYVNSINFEQDLVLNLPDHNHHKWEIANSIRESFITIPRQDFQACVSCIYLMNVEAIADSKFSLVVEPDVQPDKIITLKDDSTSHVRLKSQESAIFVIQTAKMTQEIQLLVELEESGVHIMGSHNPTLNQTNYLWKETLTSENYYYKQISLKKSTKDMKEIWDGKRKVDSEIDSFYVLLNNPTKKDSNYRLSVATKSSKIIMTGRVEQIYELNPLEKNSFVFNFLDSYEKFVDLIFYADLKEGEDVQESMEFNFRPGQRLKTQNWKQGSDERFVEEVSFEAYSAPKVRSNTSHAVVEQRFSTRRQEGKYIINVANPFEFAIKLRLYMTEGQARNSFTSKSKSEFSFEHEKEQIVYRDSGIYTTNIPNPGKWYLWVYSCGTDLDLKVENGDLETGMVTIPKGKGYLYQETITMAKDKGDLIRPMLLSSNFSEANKFIISSAVIDESEIMNYEIKKNNIKTDLSYVYKRDKSRVYVGFPPVEVQGIGSEDYLDYKILLCPDRSQRSKEPHFCGEDNECHVNYAWSIDSDRKELFKYPFDDVNYGKYFAMIQVTIRHQGRSIRSFQPYTVGYVHVRDPTFFKNLKIVLGSVALVLLTIFLRKGYMKLKAYKESKGIELQNIANTVGYNPIVDEGENKTITEDIQEQTESSEGEQINQKTFLSKEFN